MRPAATLLALLLALFAALPGVAHAAPRSDLKVVVIAGPVGDSTDPFRAQAEAAAQVADRHTRNVVRLYSPNATWPAVRDALQGASVVVYLGHGNGWPSRYRDAPYGITQNGFGLNPVAGGDDHAHQYFGEDAIAAEIELADDAVVLLHHLCYASGNTEPGLPEGTVDQARQRVDNYAAGFIRAGAGAVVAEGHLGPAWYMEQLLTGDRSIDGIWRDSPNARGHEFSFQSDRSPGYVAAMDPDRPDSGFYRSIVYRDGVGAGQLEAAPTDEEALPEVTEDVPPEPTEPTLIGADLQLGKPYLRRKAVAGEVNRLWFPYTVEDGDALDGLTIGVRWDPLDPDEAAEDAADAEGETSAEGSAPSAPANDARPSPAVQPSGSPRATRPTERIAGRPTNIEPERIGDVVEPRPASIGIYRLATDVTIPEQPGTYRLVVTLHDDSGVAYDAPTQALVTGGIVRVTDSLAAEYAVTPAAAVARGAQLELPIAVVNAGSGAWGQSGSPFHQSREERPIAARLVATWVRLTGDGGASTPIAVEQALPAGMQPGDAAQVTLQLTAPEEQGSYLVMLDVVVPGVGSLTARGVEPGMVRVTVE